MCIRSRSSGYIQNCIIKKTLLFLFKHKKKITDNSNNEKMVGIICFNDVKKRLVKLMKIILIIYKKKWGLLTKSVYLWCRNE